MLAAVVLLGLAAVPTAAESTEGLRAATTLYMVVTGIVYNVLLRGVDVGIESTAFGDLCNELLHVVVPLAILVDWLVVAPLRLIERSRAFLYLVFPLRLPRLLPGARRTDRLVPVPVPEPGRRRATAGCLLYGLVLAVVMLVLSVGIVELGRRAAVRTHGVVVPASGGDDLA